MPKIKTAKNRIAKHTPAHSPNELICIADIVKAGQPDEEGGPAAWRYALSDERPSCVSVLRDALLQAAPRPKLRLLLECKKPKEVLILSDENVGEKDRNNAARAACWAAGSYTEARRAADKVRWACIHYDQAANEISAIAAGEVRLLREENQNLEPDGLVIVLWKQSAGSFGGMAAFDLGRQICDAVFTVGVDGIEPFLDPDTSEDNNDRFFRG